MKRATKKYDITQCALYKCSSKARLEKILYLETGGLKQIRSILSYHSFEIDKKNSTDSRKITAPNETLKRVQRRILYLLQSVIRPNWLMSGEKGKCYITNGEAHRNACYVLTMDIKQFYPHCSREPVYQFFIRDLKTAPDVAKILTDIVTYDKGIPTGCPTSQMLAYYAYSDMFSEIQAIALRFECLFTLYVDDMTFSSEKPFDIQRLVREVDCTLRKNGHKLKYSKVKYYNASEYKLITGTAITPDHALVVSNRLQKSAYDHFQSLKPSLNKTALTPEDTKLVATLYGQIQAARLIEEGKFPEMLRLISGIKTSGTTFSYQKSKKHRRYYGKIRILKKAQSKPT